MDAFNLFDSEDADISYFYASRLPGEPPEGIEDIHFHPLEPRSVRATIRLRWSARPKVFGIGLNNVKIQT